MTCTSAIITLMLGATALSCAALYFYYKEIIETFRVKISSFNTALANLQDERHNLKMKNETQYLDNVTQTVEIEKLNEEIAFLKKSLVRLENDNRVLMREYSALENKRTVFTVQRANYNGQLSLENGQRAVI